LGVEGAESLRAGWIAPNLNTSFFKYRWLGGLKRSAPVSMEIALSEPLLALVNNYVRAIRFTLFRLKENVPNPEEKGVLGKSQGLYTS